MILGSSKIVKFPWEGLEEMLRKILNFIFIRSKVGGYKPLYYVKSSTLVVKKTLARLKKKSLGHLDA